MYDFAAFIVVTSAYGGSIPFSECVYTVEGYGEEVYYPTWVAA
jgi:hypothetical protein